MTSTLVDPNAVPFAMDRWRKWRYLRFVGGVENPHVLVLGGSQVGKTTLMRLIAAVSASLGCIVIVLDPKLQFKQFKGVPHVLCYCDEDEDAAAEQWEYVGRLIIREQQRRYRLNYQSPTDILSDQVRFPTIIVLADEFASFMDMSQDWWDGAKTKDDRAEAPIKRTWRKLIRMGAQARMFAVTANHTAASKEFPDGTQTRQLYGQRIVLGNDREPTSWTMAAGNGVPKPEVPEGQKGAAVLLLGNGIPPERIQCATMSDEKLYETAMSGLPILQRDGHVTENGTVLLGGVTLPRPGMIPPDVITTGQGDTRVSVVDTEQDGPDDNEGRDPQDPLYQEFPPLIVGNEAAARFLGYFDREDITNPVGAFTTAKSRAVAAGDFPQEREENGITGWDPVELEQWYRHLPGSRWKNTAKKSAKKRGA